MKINYPLKDRQICFFVLAFLPITKIFSLPSLIAGYSNEDMWISALINLLIDFLTLIPIVIACKKSTLIGSACVTIKKLRKAKR